MFFKILYFCHNHFVFGKDIRHWMCYLFKIKCRKFFKNFKIKTI